MYTNRLVINNNVFIDIITYSSRRTKTTQYVYVYRQMTVGRVFKKKKKEIISQIYIYVYYIIVVNKYRSRLVR